MQVLLQDLFLNSERSVETSREQRTSLDETFSIDVGLPENVLLNQNEPELNKSAAPFSKEFNPDLLKAKIRPDDREVILTEELAVPEPETGPLLTGQEQLKLQVDRSSADLGQIEYIDPTRETTPGITERRSALTSVERSGWQLQAPQAFDGRWAGGRIAASDKVPESEPVQPTSPVQAANGLPLAGLTETDARRSPFLSEDFRAPTASSVNAGAPEMPTAKNMEPGPLVFQNAVQSDGKHISVATTTHDDGLLQGKPPEVSPPSHPFLIKDHASLGKAQLGPEKLQTVVPTERTSANGPGLGVLQRSVPAEKVNFFKNLQPSLQDNGSDAEKADRGILRRIDGSDSYLARNYFQAKATEIWPGKFSEEFSSKVSPVLVHSRSATPDEFSATVSLEGLDALPMDDQSIQDAGRRSDSAPKTELQPRQVISQLASAVGKVMPDGTLEIRLSPEDLGRVRVTIIPGDLGFSVQLIVERGDTLDLVRRHIDILEQDLLEQGFSDMSFSAGQEQPNPDQERPLEGRTLLDDPIAEPRQNLNHSNPRPNQGVALSRLDIRL